MNVKLSLLYASYIFKLIRGHKKYIPAIMK